MYFAFEKPIRCKTYLKEVKHRILNFLCLQYAVNFLEFMNLSNEVITIAPSYFRVSNMDHSAIDIEVHLMRSKAMEA